MPGRWWLEDGSDSAPMESREHEVMEHEAEEEIAEKKRRRKLHRWEAIGLAALAGFVLIGVWLWIAVGRGMPTLDQLENPHPELATRLISADGERLDQYFIKNRTTVELKYVPRDVIAALISTEDRDFYHHWGINLWGIIRSAWTDLVTL